MPPCFNYQRGHCVFGSSCRYSHNVPQFPATSSAAAPVARQGHARSGSAGSSERGSSAGGATGRPRVDGLSPERLAGVRAANTQDPALSREALQRLGGLQAAPSLGPLVNSLSLSSHHICMIPLNINISSDEMLLLSWTGKRPEDMPFYKTVSPGISQQHLGWITINILAFTHLSCRIAPCA